MTSRRHFIASIAAALGGSSFAADGRPKTIVLQSAWDTVNIGDIGHTPGTLRVIEEHLPEVNIVLWAMKLDDRVTAMLKARFPKVTILQGSLVKDGVSPPAGGGGSSHLGQGGAHRVPVVECIREFDRTPAGSGRIVHVSISQRGTEWGVVQPPAPTDLPTRRHALVCSPGGTGVHLAG